MFDLFRSRDRSVRLLLGALLVLVALSMLTYLIPSYGAGGMTDQMVVAEIGKDVLHMQDVQKALQAQFRNRQMPPEMMPLMVPQIVEAMITERALAYQAERMGFQVNDADVANAIRTMVPALFPNGQFVGAETYAAMLGQQNVTIDEFERDMRRQLLASRLREVALQGSVVNPAEIEQEYRRRNEKIKIEYVKLSADKVRSQVDASPAELKQYYDGHLAMYQIPEKRNLAVLILDQTKLAETLNPTDAELERLYSQRKDSFRVPERVKVRHILLKTTGDAQKDAAIKTKSEDLLKKIKGGADFAALAKANSEDPGSAAKGGELGDWVTRGQTVPEFEQVAFTLPLKQTSDLVKTQYGFHILQVLDRQQAHTRTFADVKAELATDWKNQRVNDMVQQVADKAQAELQKNPAAVEKIAADYSMQLVRASGVGPDAKIPEVGDSRDFSTAVAGLAKGEVSPPVAISPTKLALALATDVTPARPASFDEVQGQVRESVLNEKAQRVMAERAAELFQKASSIQGDLKQAAQAMGLEVKVSEEFDRQGAIEGLGAANYLADAFSKPVGTLVGPVTMPDARVVAKVAGRQEADLSKLAEQRNGIREELKTRKMRERSALFEAGVREQLIKDGKIKINQEVVSRLTANYRG